MKQSKNNIDKLVKDNKHRLFQVKKNVDKTSRAGFLVFTVITVLILFAVLGYLISVSVPFIRENNFFTEFLFSNIWNPENSEFGIGTFIAASLLTTLIALSLSVPIGLGISILLVFYLPTVLRTILRVSIDMLAGIPSVIFGFFGAVFFGAFLSQISGGVIAQLSILTASLILTFMTLPTIVVFMSLSLIAVPKEIVLASLALGASQIETNFKISVRNARAGIIGAVIAGFGRAIGEAAALTFIIGGSTAFAGSNFFNDFLFRSGQSLTTILTSLFLEANGELLSALFTVGLVILIIATIVNVVALSLQNRLRKKWS